MDLNTLNKIINIKAINNIKENTNFDYFRIVKYDDDSILKEKNNVLFFPVTITSDDLKEGWYVSEYDLRPKINDVVNNNPNYFYVIEEDMIKDMPDFSKYIVVDNIMGSINKLFTKKLQNYKGKIICVTGSVGKTTTVGFIKQVLGEKALRIYSKRITPLILNNYVINFLNNNYDYFVVEASLWYKKHIEYFSKTLKPDLAILLNVCPEHIGIGDIKSVSDITKFKSLLLKYAKNSLINNMDEELRKLNIINNEIYYNDEKIVDTNVNSLIKVSSYNENIEPYIKTKLTLLQETIAYEVGKFYHIDEKEILNRLNNAIPVENRMIKKKVYDHNVIFDGDVSGVARFNNFVDHYYKNSCLVICNLTENGEENEHYEELNKLIDKFDKVFVNEQFKHYFNNDKIIYFNNLDFIKDIPKDTMIFMHYGSYYRVYDEFNIDKVGKRK